MPPDTILIVEDNEDDAYALKWAFKKAAVPNPLQVVTDGQKAIDYLSGMEPYSDRAMYPLPSTVFLDLKLPCVNGLEVLAWIRERKDLSFLHVGVLSGSDEARDHERANQLGALFYLVKPATPQQILGVLEEIRGASV